ncbi:hypothetical protein PPYR_14643 [Photinus pyralis]|uniref:Uncharacterized protein n=1 Tax=Photinus pyralis TaxID=7054 RepID=A0A5N4A5R7_PHOPY|nr:general odorant-binding protein 69a-like [Photinus pyralis]KAB0792684.1 hypothetical protein PPYR_14643 [Photinus pyralis]
MGSHGFLAMIWTLKVLFFISAAIFVSAFSTNKTTRDILDEWRERTKQEHPECLKSTGVKQEYVDQYWESVQMADDENFKCFLWCVFNGFKVINNDGTGNEELIVQTIDRMTNEIVEFCMEKADKMPDKCKRTYELINCCTRYKHAYV